MNGINLYSNDVLERREYRFSGCAVVLFQWQFEITAISVLFSELKNGKRKRAKEGRGTFLLVRKMCEQISANSKNVFISRKVCAIHSGNVEYIGTRRNFCWVVVCRCAQQKTATRNFKIDIVPYRLGAGSRFGKLISHSTSVRMPACQTYTLSVQPYT